MRSRTLFFSLAVCVLAAADCKRGCGREDGAAAAKLELGFEQPFDPGHPVLFVTWENTGEINLFLRPPLRNEFLYRGLELIADGQRCPFLYKDGEAWLDHGIFPDAVLVRPKERFSFALHLDRVWKLPERWKTLELRQRNFIHGPELVKVKEFANADERFVFDARGRRVTGAPASPSAPPAVGPAPTIPATTPPPPSLPPPAPRWPLAAGVGVAGLLLGFGAAALLFRRRGRQRIGEKA